jgi:hypothetical protein
LPRSIAIMTCHAGFSANHLTKQCRDMMRYVEWRSKLTKFMKAWKRSHLQLVDQRSVSKIGECMRMLPFWREQVWPHLVDPEDQHDCASARRRQHSLMLGHQC